MKLIYCPSCKDIVNLVPETRSCLCKSSSGYLVTKDQIAHISGRAVPISIQYKELKGAINSRPYYGIGQPCNLWIIPEKNRSVVIDEPEFSKVKSVTAEVKLDPEPRLDSDNPDVIKLPELG